ncbi:MAG: M15 family metallopeptidase [Acidimicrobiales bacterium]
MTRRRWWVLVTLAGLALGMAAALLVDTGPTTEPRPGADGSGSDPAAATPTTPIESLSVEPSVPTTSDPPLGQVVDGPAAPPELLVWSTNGLSPSLGPALRAMPDVAASTIVRGDDLRLTASWSPNGAVVDQTAPGWYLPLDAFAVDPTSYASVVTGGAAVAAALQAPGSAVLGQTSAGLRHAEVGSVLQIAGRDQLTVTAIVPDADVAAAELVVSYATGTATGVTTERAALVRYTGDRVQLERAVTASIPKGTHTRFRSAGETTYLRHGDAVLPQALVKQRFGEFAVHPADGAALDIDPAWVAANIVVADLPVLGRTLCNRQIVPMVSGALQELADAGLTGLVDPTQFGGCFNPRLIGPGLGLSRHTWGIALDVNVATNPLGGSGRQDPRLVEIMRRWGLAWGGDWLRPDPMHFEYLTPPR